MAGAIDPTCLLHGRKLSEHQCTYCCLCFRDLTPEECHVLPYGEREDVCSECARAEEKAIKRQVEP
jgi:hypothetical protein